MHNFVLLLGGREIIQLLDTKNVIWLILLKQVKALREKN